MPGASVADLELFLKRLTSRSMLDADERSAILDLPARVEHVQANRDFVRLGERVDHASLLVDGLVGSFGQTSQGTRQITALFIPGDMPDLHSVVRPVGAAALQALCPSTIVRVPHAALRGVAARFPAVAEAFWRDCVVDAAILAQWVVNVGRRDARTRMAHLLCEMAVRYTGRKANGTFSFPVTQTHLADATGMTSVHVNRTLKQLREEGLALCRGRQVTILDWPGLAAIGEFDAGYLLNDILQPQRRVLEDG